MHKLYIAALIVIAALFAGCASSRSHFVDYGMQSLEPEVYGDVFDWQHAGPFEFIDQLTSVKTGSYTVLGVHHAWLREDDLPGLIALLDSDERCMSVCRTISSYLDTEGSTVGHEAAFLIEGFNKGIYPPALHSKGWTQEEDCRVK